MPSALTTSTDIGATAKPVSSATSRLFLGFSKSRFANIGTLSLSDESRTLIGFIPFSSPCRLRNGVASGSGSPIASDDKSRTFSVSS